MPDLHVYKLGPDWFVAESPEDALACAAEYYHAMGVEPQDSEPALEPDDKLLQISRRVASCEVESHVPAVDVRSCAEWAKSNGRGLLCSTEW
jgi:hypothetical protein